MQLPVMPPLSPMLAKPAAAIPTGASYEPKWDGFRCIVFRDGNSVELGSRNTRSMTRYFPELEKEIRAQLPQRCVIDGEIVIAGANGLDFEALQQRIHPAASRVNLLAEQTPASFIGFDLLALGERDFTGEPFTERRAALAELLSNVVAPLHLTPVTDDRSTADRWFTELEGAGLDGVIAKPLDGTYQPGKRTMIKVKHTRTADCVLAGFRWHKASTDDAPLIGSLLLGLYTDDGKLAHVGVAGSFTAQRRAELVDELAPMICDSGTEHPWQDWVSAAAHTEQRLPGNVSRWNATKDLSFVPLRPERVIEVKYEHMEGTRFRHLAHFLRWRADRDPSSCTYAQLDEPLTYALSDIVAGLGQ